MLSSQSSHRQALIDNLANKIREYRYPEKFCPCLAGVSRGQNLSGQLCAEDTEHQFYNAAVRVLLSWLEYNLEDVEIIDSRDQGIDAWFIADPTKSADAGIDIFQIKTHEPTQDGILSQQPFDGMGVSDLI